jgi:hypothetical protein
MRCLHGLRQDGLVVRRILRPQEHLILLLPVATASLASVLPLAATRAAAAHRRGESEINVLFAVDTDKERRDVDHLLANSAQNREISISQLQDFPSLNNCFFNAYA